METIYAGALPFANEKILAILIFYLSITYVFPCETRGISIFMRLGSDTKLPTRLLGFN